MLLHVSAVTAAEAAAATVAVDSNSGLCSVGVIGLMPCCHMIPTCCICCGSARDLLLLLVLLLLFVAVRLVDDFALACLDRCLQPIRWLRITGILSGITGFGQVAQILPKTARIKGL